jgi:integrase
MGVQAQRPTGHVYRVDRKREPVWYAKYRLPDGRQVQRKIGPVWTERGKPSDGYYTKRAAREWLDDVLQQARQGVLPGMVRTGATFADAAGEWLRYVEHERGRKPSTIADYRSAIKVHLNPAFGDLPLERITTETIEAWLAEKAKEASWATTNPVSCGSQPAERSSPGRRPARLPARAASAAGWPT